MIRSKILQTSRSELLSHYSVKTANIVRVESVIVWVDFPVSLLHCHHPYHPTRTTLSVTVVVAVAVVVVVVICVFVC